MGQYSTSSILCLSTELHLCIASFLNVGCDADLRSWSLTCSFFQSLFVPLLYRRVKLQNTLKVGSSIKAISDGPNRAYLKEMHFVGTAPSNANGSETDEAPKPFQDVVYDVLSNLSRFPNLESVHIVFPFGFDNEEWEDDFYMFDEEESEEQIAEAERDEAWRGIMAKTFQALAQNKKPCCKKFEIKQLVAREVSTFNDKAFHAFLGRIEQFKLSIRGADNGAGWEINTLEGFLAFISRLDRFFFNHLRSVTDLTIVADVSGPIGLEGMNHARLALDEAQMPLLKTIYLENVFICPELVGFLAARTATLESISLNECYASIGGLAENGIQWSEFLTALYDAKSKKLCHLSITPSDVPLSMDEKYKSFNSKKAASEEVIKARKSLKENTHLRLFAYASVDDKYGTLFADEDENLASFQDGEDQRAYDRLMEVVNENQALLNTRLSSTISICSIDDT